MNIKKEVFNKMVQMAELELDKTNRDIKGNSRIINAAAYQNTILKRQKVVLVKLINEFTKEK